MFGARRAALISLGLLLACNSIVGFGDLSKVPAKADGGKKTGDDDDIVGDDDDIQSEAGKDGPSGGPRCDPKKPFAAPEVLTKLDGAMETKRAIMTRDELEIFY